MNHKWGSNEGIHVGDIFRCNSVWYDYGRPEYYQVVALRGRTQVVLHAIRWETYTQEGISEDGPLYFYRTRTRPLPGQFMAREEMWEICAFWKGGKEIVVSGEEVTAWVEPDRGWDGRPRLREMGYGGRRLGYYYELAQPEDWEPWDAATARKKEEAARREEEGL